MFRSIRLSVVAASLVAGFAGTALSAGSAFAADGGASTAEQGARHGGHGHRHHRHHDLLRAASRLPDLTDAQRAQIRTLEHAKHAPWEAARTAHQALAQAVAAQVDANKVDRSKLTSQLKAVSDADAAVRTADATALTGLHGVLTPAQRAELADGASAKLAEHAQKRAAHQANATDANAKAGGGGGGGPDGHWAHALGLSPAQEAQIRTNLKAANVAPPAPGTFEAQAQQLLTDFKKDSFTAPTTLGVGPHPGHLVDLAQAALPVLSNAQRTELSNLLRGPQAQPEGADGADEN